MILVRSGSLLDEPLPALVHALYRERLTGVLFLIGAGTHAEVYVRQGYPTGATLADHSDQLGQVLLDAKMIDEGTYKGALANCIADGVLFGQSLVAAGTLTSEQLQEALRLQIRRRLFRLFYMDEGEFAIQSGEHWVGLEGPQSLRIQPRRAIYQGIRSAWTPERVRRSLAPLEGKAVRMTVDPVSLGRYGYTDADQRIAIEMAARPTTAEEVAAQTGQAIDGVRAVVCTLYYTDGLEITALALPTRPGEAGAARIVAEPAERPGPPPLQMAPPQQEEFPPEELTAVAPPPRSPSGPGPISPSSWGVSSPAVSPKVPAMGGGARLSSEANVYALREIIAAKKKVVEEGDFFEVLGLPREADGAAVKSAYLFASKVLHPDRLTGPGMESLRPDAERIYHRLAEAYATLRDDRRREVYLQQLNVAKASPGDQQKMRAILEAEMAMLDGEQRFHKRDFVGAVEAFGKAVKLNPDAGEPRALLAWSRFSAGQASMTEIKPDLRRAAILSPDCARVHLYLGKLLKEEGDLDASFNELRKALHLDRRLDEAWSELRLVAMRREKQQGNKGLFDRFKKK